MISYSLSSSDRPTNCKKILGSIFILYAFITGHFCMFAARETYYFQIILGSGSSIYVDFFYRDWSLLVHISLCLYRCFALVLVFLYFCMSVKYCLFYGYRLCCHIWQLWKQKISIQESAIHVVDLHILHTWRFVLLTSCFIWCDACRNAAA